ncbi:MAG: PAS domain S-box protein [Archaeoglobaceae archaeon]
MNFEELFNDFPLAILILGENFAYENRKAKEIKLKENLGKDIITYNNKIFKIIEKKLRDFSVFIGIEYTEEQRNTEILRIYQRFFREAKDFFFILDNRGRFLEVNPSYEILGFKKDEIVGKNSRVIAFEDQIDVLRENFKKVLNGETVRFVFKAKTAKGETRFLDVLEWPRFSDGEIIGSEGVARDVTDSKKMEIELERTNRALKILNKINQQIFREIDEYSLLLRVQGILKEFGIKSYAWLVESGNLLEAVPNASECQISGKTEFKFEKCACPKASDKSLVIPMTFEGKILGILALCSIGELWESEIQIFSQLSEDLGFAINHYKVERQRRILSHLLTENLRQFEALADKLRNPLAIAMGYAEIRKEVGCDKAIEEIEKQLRRILETVEELRFQETLSYLLTKK